VTALAIIANARLAQVGILGGTISQRTRNAAEHDRGDQSASAKGCDGNSPRGLPSKPHIKAGRSARTRSGRFWIYCLEHV
jgi:hypothetical protein